MMVDKIESIQLVVFLGAAATTNAHKLWETLELGDPTGYNTLGPGQTQAQGEIGGDQLVLVVQPLRIDFYARGIETLPAVVPVEPPAIIDPDNACSALIEALSKIASNLTTVRVAAVFQGRSMAPSSALAMEKLRALLPVLPIPPGADEITYQVVVPRASGVVPQRGIRQICKWQNVTMQLLGIQVAGNIAQPTMSPMFAAHLYVDVFLEPGPILDPGQVRPALNEVLALARKILDEGFVNA